MPDLAAPRTEVVRIWGPREAGAPARVHGEQVSGAREEPLGTAGRQREVGGHHAEAGSSQPPGENRVGAPCGSVHMTCRNVLSLENTAWRERSQTCEAARWDLCAEPGSGGRGPAGARLAREAGALPDAECAPELDGPDSTSVLTP